MHTFFFTRMCFVLQFILKCINQGKHVNNFNNNCNLFYNKRYSLASRKVSMFKVTNNFTVRRWFKLFGTSANYQSWWHGFGIAMFTLFTYKAVDSMATVNGTPCAGYKDRFRFFNIKIIQCF